MEPHANAEFHPLTATTTASRQTDRVGLLDLLFSKAISLPPMR